MDGQGQDKNIKDDKEECDLTFTHHLVTLLLCCQIKGQIADVT